MALRVMFGARQRISRRTEAGAEIGGGLHYVSFVPRRGHDTSIEPTSLASLWRFAIMYDVRGSFVASHTRWSLLLGASG